MDERLKSEFLRAKLISIEQDAEEAESKVREHLTELEQLEANYGLDIEAYAGLYGEVALDGRSHVSRMLLLGWKELYEGIADESQTVGVYVVTKKLADGCYGFGQEAVYEYTESGIIIDGPATISFVTKKDAGDWKGFSTVNAILSGTLYVSGFGDASGKVESVLLASNSPAIILGRDHKPSFDDETTIITAPSGREFYFAAKRIENMTVSDHRYSRVNESGVAGMYHDSYKQQQVLR